jgi:hypothetical protein
MACSYRCRSGMALQLTSKIDHHLSLLDELPDTILIAQLEYYHLGPLLHLLLYILEFLPVAPRKDDFELISLGMIIEMSEERARREGCSAVDNKSRFGTVGHLKSRFEEY